MFPRFLRWLPKHRLSTPPKRSLLLMWGFFFFFSLCLAMASLHFVFFVIFFFFFFLGSLWYSDVLKSSAWMWGAWWVCMGSIVEWSLSDVWMWPWEVLVSWWPGTGSGSTHLPLEMIPAHPCPSIRLADLLTNEEIAHAWIGRTVPRIPIDYLEFI